jgi:hypothetical protein
MTWAEKVYFYFLIFQHFPLTYNLLISGGEKLALGVRGNKKILRVDVRLTNIGLDLEYDVGMHLRKNRNKIINQYSLLERDDTYPDETESGIIEKDPLNEPVWSSEEEDEGEEEEEDEEEEEEDADEENEEENKEIKVVKAPGPMVEQQSKTVLQ